MVTVEQPGLRRFRRQRREGGRTDETLSALGQHRCDVRAGVDQTPAEFHRLVRGDATSDAEYHVPARKWWVVARL
jgi:hypothetical protein